MEINDYLDLITSEHRDKTNFLAMITSDVSVQVRVQNLLESLTVLFDLDTAVGQQLDVIGQWVGISRNVSIPVAGVYFSWDGSQTVGWDFGVWRDASAPANITTLPDDSYRVLIKTRIAANHWDGTTNGAYAIWDAIFTTFTILINDKQNMSYDLAFVGGVVDSLTLALLAGGYIPLKPEGVKVNIIYVPINDGPLFGWDVDTTYIKGWDSGSWTREIIPT